MKRPTSEKTKKTWAAKTERRVTCAVLTVVGTAVALLIVAWWHLRG